MRKAVKASLALRIFSENIEVSLDHSFFTLLSLCDPSNFSSQIILTSQFHTMKLSLSTLLALATAPVLIFTTPYIEIDIKESPLSQSQAPFHDLADQCQPENALFMESPFNLPCCEGNI
jgi:hypothetical protein